MQNEAIQNKKELIALFDHFVINKLNEYKIKEKQIDTAVSAGYYYVELINQHDYDSIWKQTSPLLEKYASEEEFTNMLKQRNKFYKSSINIKVEARIMYDDIDNIQGEFYSIYYVADNNTKEKITLQNINHTYKLLAYQCALPK